MNVVKPSAQLSPKYLLFHHPPSTYTHTLLASAPMSHTQPIATSSSNFRQVFSDALKEYERRTKQDLLANPLVAQLQACESPNGILLVLQQQVQDPDRSQNADILLTKWLVPMVNVLCAFSAAVGEGVGLVCSRS